jgi:glyoxylase-like metal-dependent hydrolase (beta-lactamase superfamily II)
MARRRASSPRPPSQGAGETGTPRSAVSPGRTSGDCEPEAQPIEVGALLARLDRGDDLLVLDVRNDDDFERWRLEARRPVPTLHLPYFEFIEDPQAAAVRVPRGGAIAVLCAYGGSSEYVVEALREAGIPARNVAGGMVAYGDLLEALRVPTPGTDSEIWQINRRGKGCLSYVLVCRGEAVVVDPARQVDWYSAFVRARDARLARVLDTHVHADHVSGGPALAAAHGAPYFVSAGPGAPVNHAVTALADGERLRLGGDGGVTLEVKLIESPGHTPGSTCYLVGERWLLTGDTLFVGGVGRPDLGGQVDPWGRALFRTLRARLAALGDDVVVLPAHWAGAHEMGPDGVVAARLGDLRRRLPELALPDEDAFVAAVKAGMSEPPEAYARMVGVNLGLEAAEPDKLAEWELGKNQCAATPRRL